MSPRDRSRRRGTTSFTACKFFDSLRIAMRTNRIRHKQELVGGRMPRITMRHFLTLLWPLLAACSDGVNPVSPIGQKPVGRDGGTVGALSTGSATLELFNPINPSAGGFFMGGYDVNSFGVVVGGESGQ